MIRGLSQSNNTVSSRIFHHDPNSYLMMINNYFSVLNTIITHLRDIFPDRELTLSVGEVIEGNIHWKLQMQWDDIQGRQHVKTVRGLFEIPATTEKRPFMEMEYRHSISHVEMGENVTETAEYDEMWYHQITYVRMVEFIHEVERWMKCVELDRV
jgi:hypothetical protein